MKPWLLDRHNDKNIKELLASTYTLTFKCVKDLHTEHICIQYVNFDILYTNNWTDTVHIQPLMVYIFKISILSN